MEARILKKNGGEEKKWRRGKKMEATKNGGEEKMEAMKKINRVDRIIVLFT